MAEIACVHSRSDLVPPACGIVSCLTVIAFRLKTFDLANQERLRTSFWHLHREGMIAS